MVFSLVVVQVWTNDDQFESQFLHLQSMIQGSQLQHCYNENHISKILVFIYTAKYEFWKCSFFNFRKNKKTQRLQIYRSFMKQGRCSKLFKEIWIGRGLAEAFLDPGNICA